MTFHPGRNVTMGRDHTLHSTLKGRVRIIYDWTLPRRYVEVVPHSGREGYYRACQVRRDEEGFDVDRKHGGGEIARKADKGKGVEGRWFGLVNVTDRVRAAEANNDPWMHLVTARPFQ